MFFVLWRFSCAVHEKNEKNGTPSHRQRRLDASRPMPVWHASRSRSPAASFQNASASSEDRTRRRYGAPRGSSGISRGSSGISRGSSGSCILSAYRSAAYHATARLDRFRHQLYLFKKLWRSTTVYCGAATWQWIFRLLLPRSAQNRWRPGCHEGGEALGPVEESTVACSR